MSVTNQIQLKLSLSPELNTLLKKKASSLGLPVTQFVKHLIVQEVKTDYPVYKASEATERASAKAMKQIDKAVTVTDIHDFFKKL